MTPLVSILIPSLNNRRFLEDRMASIFSQTLHDWELIVVDNYSDDGAWEFFQTASRKDNRIRVSQAPREGLYANWNNCIRQASGRYVYIAGNDDIMADDFLEKQASALEQHPECGLAHCRLRMIDESGRDDSDWWSTGSLFARSSNGLLGRKHIRLAPFDGCLHLSGESLYISLTQVLIRRSLFDQIGLFESRWGSVADFNWCMRATLATNTIHVPDTWGAWRLHSDQATIFAALYGPEHGRNIDEMVENAIERSEKFLAPGIREPLRCRWAGRARGLRRLYSALRDIEDVRTRRMFLAGQLLCGSWAARQHVRSRLSKDCAPAQSWPKLVKSWLKGKDIDPVLKPLNDE
jgi:glycosyltransferase involved in cell wall biosynthesis